MGDEDNLTLLAEPQPPEVAVKPQCTVVGIGASAGGITALKHFFEKMTGDSGMAFVVVVHLSSEHASNLAAILQGSTSLPVVEVTETLKIEPNHVYVIPPGKYLTMVDGEVRLTEQEVTRGRRGAIDVFLRTLAAASGRNAICVILSGTGSDGTLGLKRIKEEGGIAIAQDPADAEYDPMPRSAIATNLVDLVLPAAEIPAKLVALMRSADRIQLSVEAHEKAPARTDPVREVLAMLRVRSGHDFSSYKWPTIGRRIGRRVQVHELADVSEYIDYLRRHPEEMQALLSDLLITVTNFFRDRDAYKALEQQVVPQLFANKTSADQVRVWVVGCATGEEAYSIAILLREFAARLTNAPTIQVFATDISEQAITTGRQCRYDETIVADVSPERLRQFFVREDHHYNLKKEVRESVLFAPHNVLRDPPFSRIDLISCRNLLIYLNHDSQGRVLDIFHFALRRDGFLFLGTSESAEGTRSFFTPFDKKNRIYKAHFMGAAHRAIPVMPMPGKWTTRLPESPLAPHQKEFAIGVLHHRLVEQYAPPSVLINEEGEIVHLSEHAGRYLHLSGGEPTHNLLAVVHPNLQLDLRTALLAARQDNHQIEARNLSLTLDGESRLVHLIVSPLSAATDIGHAYYLVIFDEKRAGAPEPEPSPPLPSAGRVGGRQSDRDGGAPPRERAPARQRPAAHHHRGVRDLHRRTQGHQRRAPGNQ
ncbi:MAG: chemotaxis protein CheB [Deltaproteobacteria bacterium]|nr:chemotaxis protein CheB [Deltaproteobacteria bacterium]MDZ4343548.1 chemotaxis protein CheB [Candidatus Binatia bacterium]